jgi:hypothetical protein
MRNMVLSLLLGNAFSPLKYEEAHYSAPADDEL